MDDFLQGARPHETTNGKESQLTVAAVAAVERGVVLRCHLPLDSTFSPLIRLLRLLPKRQAQPPHPIAKGSQIGPSNPWRFICQSLQHPLEPS